MRGAQLPLPQDAPETALGATCMASVPETHAEMTKRSQHTGWGGGALSTSLTQPWVPRPLPWLAPPPWPGGFQTRLPSSISAQSATPSVPTIIFNYKPEC